MASTLRRRNWDATLGLSFHLLMVAIVVVGVLLARAAAQERTPSACDACLADYRQYCFSVTPGGGRIRRCMLEHADELSDA
jgi:hypothetical protein